MKKKHLLKLTVLAALSAPWLTACNEKNIDIDEPSPVNYITDDDCHGQIVLGEKLDDPYTVTNITKAFKKLYPTKAALNISATDLYVRFRARDENDIKNLEALGAELIDHPVDYKIVRDGDWYHDPSIPEDEITWQYSLVPHDFEFPEGIEYELLDECYLSEHDVITRSELKDIDWEAVERESFILTGNGDFLLTSKDGTKGSNCPSGCITIVDDKYSPEPIGVKGVKISANVFVKFANAYTDESGNYTLSRSFSSMPHYRLVFKNEKGFALGFNLILVNGAISTLGKGSSEGISCQIDKNSNRSLFCRCVVNNAAYEYYKDCENSEPGIKLPPSNLRIWLFYSMKKSSAPMLQQGAMVDGSCIERFLGDFTSLLKSFLPDITLGVNGLGDYAEIYGVTIHELAHASHYMEVGNKFWNSYIDYVMKSFLLNGGNPYGSGTDEKAGYCAVGESWGYYMQTKVWRERYPADAKSFGTSYWFKPQILYYMDERGLNKYKLYKALSSDVTSMDMMKARLLSLYPECKTIITQAFERYQ